MDEKEFKRLRENFRRHACNNYRKLHNLPMRRWKYMFR